jgi:hypothetical protein
MKKFTYRRLRVGETIMTCDHFGVQVTDEMLMWLPVNPRTVQNKDARSSFALCRRIITNIYAYFV